MQFEKRKKLFLIEKGYYDLIDKYFKDMLKDINAMTAIEWQYEEDIRKYGLFFEILCLQDPFYIKASNNVHYDNMTVNTMDYITFFNCIFSVKKIEKYVLLDCDMNIALIIPTFGFEFGDKKFLCIDEKTNEMANEYMAWQMFVEKWQQKTSLWKI